MPNILRKVHLSDSNFCFLHLSLPSSFLDFPPLKNHSTTHHAAIKQLTGAYLTQSHAQMADDRDDITSMVFEDDPQPSQYLTSIVASSPGSRRAQTINLDNPHNRAVAYPAYHVGIDAKEAPPMGNFGVRMAKIDADSHTLASTATGRPNKYRSRAVVAAERREKLIAKSNKSRKGKKVRVNPAPGRVATSSTESGEEVVIPKATRRRAAVAGEKKRKRASRTSARTGTGAGAGTEAEAEAEAEESEEDTPGPKRRAAKRKSVETTTVASRAAVVPAIAAGFGPSSLLRKRDSGIKVPKSIGQAGDADRMLWEWRHAGKPWADITRKWKEMTGKTPGKSTLSVRFIKLQENFAQTGGADDILLLQYKAEAEAELEEALWQKVSGKVKANFNTEIAPAQLRKRYNALKQSGFEIGGEIDVDDATEAAEVSAEPPALVDYSSSESDI